MNFWLKLLRESLLGIHFTLTDLNLSRFFLWLRYRKVANLRSVTHLFHNRNGLKWLKDLTYCLALPQLLRCRLCKLVLLTATRLLAHKLTYSIILPSHLNLVSLLLTKSNHFNANRHLCIINRHIWTKPISPNKY